MNQEQPIELLQRVRAISQHEAAHWLTAIALGFDAEEIRLEVQSLEVHSGKANTNFDARCETLQEMQLVIRRRALVKLAGAMGEALNPVTNRIDARAAQEILEEGVTGAGQDYAIAKELTVLLYNSTMVQEGFTSRDLLVELQGEAFAIVSRHATTVCDLADALTRQVLAGKGLGVLQKHEIHQIPLYCQIPYPWAHPAH